MSLPDEPIEYWPQWVRYKLFNPALLFPRLPQYDQRGSRLPRVNKRSNQRHIDTDSHTVLRRSSALVMGIQSAFFVVLKASRGVRIGTAAGLTRGQWLTRLNAATTKEVKGHAYRTEINTINNKTGNLRVTYHLGAFAWPLLPWKKKQHVFHILSASL